MSRVLRNRRAVMLFGLAITFGVGAAYTARTATQVGSAGAAAAVETTKVVVARVDIEAGTALRREQLEMVDWPSEFVPAGAHSDQPMLQGRVLKRPLSVGEPVMASALMPAGSQAGLVSVIDEDRRAVSVKVDPVIGVAGFVSPGSRVDVLATLQRSGRHARESYSKVILQDVAVLAIDQKMETARDGEPELVSVVTLSVTPTEAQKLTYSAHEGRLQLALRRPGDDEVVETSSVGAADLLREPRRTTHGRARHYVQVINGAKITTKSF